MTQRPDGWSRSPDGHTWDPPVTAAVQKAWEVPPDVAQTVVRDAAVLVRDAGNDLVVRMGKLTGGDYGLEVFDGDGNTRVIIGNDDGDFDVKVFDTSGSSVALSTLAFGQQFDFVDTQQDTTSISDTDLATDGPSVTVDVGTSGRALVWGGAYAIAPGGATVALTTIYVDGVLESDFVKITTEGAGDVVAASLARALIVTGLSAGEHEIKMRYASSDGGLVGFADRWLLVLPT